MLTQWIDALFNSPAFYVVCVFSLIVVLYIITQADMQRLRYAPRLDRRRMRNQRARYTPPAPARTLVQCDECRQSVPLDEAFFDQEDQCYLCGPCMQVVVDRTPFDHRPPVMPSLPMRYPR
jgi:hypothetical protein